MLFPNLWPAARTGQRWLLNARRRVTTVDGHRMVYLERGHPRPGRPTVVLIHGFASMKENWALWLQALPRHWHLLVPDLPGLGESDYRVEACYRYQSQAQRLNTWLEQQPAGDLHLAGSSMGGAIAAILAHHLATPPRSLTLLNSAGIPEQPDRSPDAPFQSDRDQILIPRDWRGVYRMFNSVGNGRPSVLGVAMTGLLGPDLLGRTRALEHIFRDMLADPLAPARYLGKDTPPMQVQWGDRDTITPTRCVRWFERATPGAELHLFPGVGHLPMVEVPRRSASVFARFVARHQP
ncbi:alpha/beta fold hydrolase [uncultured Marinobacter sp.]|jgi:pimeloyl-ACP methyl ester carboxylesterase|uniref:alpha/beta fold hydrolase n=1 Tax=uncultured Marinobacter sp. TaxID=187379 RepID=UPI000C0AB2C3|nr:alpha/beta hydrolase [Marinobacter sp.]MBI43359.1 alpha/beta hydrolase [Oceanospirillales bacterium]|tara:strand:- start:1459 stop:2340 length:882 start_codon:yes stop_codon:yes gene_type:complete